MKSDHSSNGRGHTTETPDVSHLRNVGVAHEMSEVNIRGVLTFLIGLTVMTIAVYLLMWGMFRVMFAQEDSKETKDSPPSPMAMRGDKRLPAEPRLQSARGFGETLEKEAGETPTSKSSATPKDPLWEIDVLRKYWQTTLEKGTRDQSGKPVVVPIEEAKKQLLSQGLPMRTTTPSEASDYGAGMPTAASSGLVSGRQ
jgi:hypothetical protein